MDCGVLVGSETTVGVGGLMGGELFFWQNRQTCTCIKRSGKSMEDGRCVGVGGFLEGERFICKIHGKK